jgi:hypothetical protein
MGHTSVYGAGTYASSTITNISGGSYWTSIPSGMYSSTPSSTSRIAMSDTSLLRKGLALRYRYPWTLGQDTFYGVVGDISTNSYVDIRGAPLDTDIDLTELAFSPLVSQFDIFVPGTFADSTHADAIETKLGIKHFWYGPLSYLVSMRAKYNGGSGSPQINFGLGNLDVWDSHMTVSKTWSDGPALTDNDRTFYLLPSNARFWLHIKSAASAAEDLTVSLTIVHE